MIVDTHSHVIAEDTQRYPLSPLGGHQSAWSQERPVNCQQMLASMDEAGVDKSVLVQSSTCYGHDNTYVADCLAEHPDRFVGVFSVDVLASDACDRILYWLDRKFSGLRLFTTGSTLTKQAEWLDNPRTFPAWQMAGDFGLSMCVQMSTSATGQLISMSERFPKVKILLDHLAKPTLSDGPSYAEAAPLWSLVDRPNIYLKVTPRTFTEVHEGSASPETFFPLLVERFGAQRLMWGSNFPASEGTLGDLLGVAKHDLSMLSKSDQEWIMGKTAKTVYPGLARR